MESPTGITLEPKLTNRSINELLQTLEPLMGIAQEPVITHLEIVELRRTPKSPT
jgi:hypothetical protein